jgi:hypothetical protein
MPIEAKPRSGLEFRRAPLDVSDLPSVTKHERAWNYRAMKKGLIKYVKMGDKRVVPPDEADRIEREGIPSLRPADAPPRKWPGRPPASRAPTSGRGPVSAERESSE